MGTVAEHEKRSQEIADTTRRVVVTLNGGGIGVVFSVAGTLAAKGVYASVVRHSVWNLSDYWHE